MVNYNFSSVYRILLSIPGSVVAGLTIYLILQTLFSPLKIPISIIISILVFGLTNCYGSLEKKNNKDEQFIARRGYFHNAGHTENINDGNNLCISKIFFVVAY